jgi:hypothetical protein
MQQMTSATRISTASSHMCWPYPGGALTRPPTPDTDRVILVVEGRRWRDPGARPTGCAGWRSLPGRAGPAARAGRVRGPTPGRRGSPSCGPARRWRTADRPGVVQPRHQGEASPHQPVGETDLAAVSRAVEHPQHCPGHSLRRGHGCWRPARHTRVVGRALVDGGVHTARRHHGHVHVGQVAVVDGQLSAESRDSPFADGVRRHVRRGDVAEHRADQHQIPAPSPRR